MVELKLSMAEIIARLSQLEWGNGLAGLVGGMMLYRSDESLWSELLVDWSNSIGEAAEFAECRESMKRYSARIREQWSCGEASGQDPKLRRNGQRHE